VTLPHCGLEPAQLDLVPRALVDVDVDRPPLVLLVVLGVVLRGRDDTLALDSARFGDDQAADQEWILAERLKFRPARGTRTVFSIGAKMTS